MPIDVGEAGLFSLDPKGAPFECGMSNAQIEKRLKRSILGPYFLRAPKESIICQDFEMVRRQILETSLALQIYYHEHGNYPDSLEQLVGDLLESAPVDPFGVGESIRFRREAADSDGVTLWSIGPDGVDDEARLKYRYNENQVDAPGDIFRHVLPPRRPAETKADSHAIPGNE
jgi:hypothetical protein